MDEGLTFGDARVQSDAPDDNGAIASLGEFALLHQCSVLNCCSCCVSGEWLRDQQTMEDTITILQQEGWMV